MVERRNRCQKIHVLILAFAQTVLWLQGNYLILFSSLVYLSKYMNNTGLLDWMILDSANVYKGFENINYARLKRCKLLAVHYVL